MKTMFAMFFLCCCLCCCDEIEGEEPPFEICLFQDNVMLCSFATINDHEYLVVIVEHSLSCQTCTDVYSPQVKELVKSIME